MTTFRGQREAFGKPGIEPRWTQGNKDGVGTAYETSTDIWFTLFNGILTEVYYPTIDQPQLRDMQYLITDGKSFCHEEKRHLHTQVERSWNHALGYRIANSDPEGRYTLTKEVITDPHLPCILQRTELSGEARFISQLRLYALCAPHLEVGGWGNNAYVIEVAGRELLVAEKDGTWLTMMATVPFKRLSCGYVGHSDGWTDLSSNFELDWEFDRATNGNIALTGELDWTTCNRFTLGIAFGSSLHGAVTTLFSSLDVPFKVHRKRYVEQWNRACADLLPLHKVSCNGGNLYHGSVSLLLAHEDKTYPGALIASLAIPWGEAKGDENREGYHMVWTRDMVNSAMGLLAAGDRETPLRALVYLATSQQADGNFAQNFWVNGEPHWSGVQLDQVAFPILLSWHLEREGILRNFDPYVMVMRAAGYLICYGPATQQDRWEEASGYSPSTLASNIAALIGAACLARKRKDEETACFLEEYADFLESHLRDWTVTTQGTLVPGISRHFIRIHPVDIHDPEPDEDPNHGLLKIANLPAGIQSQFPACEIVDAGFLELVRYGICKPDDPLVVDSLQVVDALLKVKTPYGPGWHRYNHDGFGQRADGGPFTGAGVGRVWPLLTGERGHYELAAGGYVRPFIRAMERFASPTGLLPEQVWDESDRPDRHLYLGKPTGSAMPLMWAHAEYIKLLRSVADGRVFDCIPEVAQRYLGNRECRPIEVWKFNRRTATVGRGATLRILKTGHPFRLRWSRNEWQNTEEMPSRATVVGIEYVDIAVPLEQQPPIRFTFYWTGSERWEGRDYMVSVV